MAYALNAKIPVLLVCTLLLASCEDKNSVKKIEKSESTSSATASTADSPTIADGVREADMASARRLGGCLFKNQYQALLFKAAAKSSADVGFIARQATFYGALLGLLHSKHEGNDAAQAELLRASDEIKTRFIEKLGNDTASEREAAWSEIVAFSTENCRLSSAERQAVIDRYSNEDLENLDRATTPALFQN